MIAELKALELLGNFVGKLMGLRADRKREVSGYLDAVAESLALFPARLRDNASVDELLGYAKETETHAHLIAGVVSDVLPSDQVEKLETSLNDAFAAKEFLARHASVTPEESLVILSQAAAECRAYARVLRGTISRP
jgi:hypothetical protein